MGWINDSVIDHNIYVSEYNTLAGSIYMKLRKELDCRKKLFGLIITFCRSSFRKSKKLDKLFEEKFNFEDT